MTRPRALTATLVLFFALAYALSWAAWAPLVLAARGGRPATPYLHLLGGLGPALAALLAAAWAGRGAVQALVARLVVRRAQAPWVAFAALVPLALYALSAGALSLLGHPSAGWSALGASSEYPSLPRPLYCLATVVFYGFGEEIGWRGFALPRWQSRHGALASSLRVAALWAAWHLPLFWFAGGLSHMGFAGGVGWFASMVTGSILMTALFNASGGSIVAVAVFHGVLDVVMTSPGAPMLPSVMGALLTIAGVAVVPTFGAENLSRRERQKHAAPA